ncbi:MAG: ArsC family reductase [Gammaproteobacteria bacterium]|nr:ArsC family reductase [Gammaproteobacteria bacterium]
MTMHGIANCDSIKKAKQWLTNAGLEYQFRDYKKNPPSRSELQTWADLLGWESLLNKRGTTWRKLDPAIQANIAADNALQLLAEHPSMIKRPLIIKDGQALVGFQAATYTQFFA